MITLSTASSLGQSQPAPQSAFDHTLICFSHLRWNFVFQRPQHLMSRFAEARRVIFWEEPEAALPGMEPALGVRTCEMGHRAYFTTAVEMARRLSLALAENRLHREMNKLVQ